MGKAIAKVFQMYIFPWLVSSVDSSARFDARANMVSYPHCQLGIMNEEAKRVNYVEALEGDLVLVSRDQYPNGVNFYIDNMGNLIVYTDDGTQKNFDIDSDGNLIYTS